MLSDKLIKQKIAPEVSRILNSNGLNTEINVKVITEEQAKLITSDFLRDNRSAIMPIVAGRDIRAPGSSLGMSTITKNGFVMTNPDETYMNYPAAENFSRTLGLTMKLVLKILKRNRHSNHLRVWQNGFPLT